MPFPSSLAQPLIPLHLTTKLSISLPVTSRLLGQIWTTAANAFPIVVPIIALCSLTANRASAAEIRGTVSNQNTHGFLERASIQAGDIKVLTDKEGNFRISNLAPGTYTLTADYTDLEPVSKTITVGGDDTTRVEFELTSSQVYKLAKFQ